MKVTVIQPFVDKYTQFGFNPGQSVEFADDRARFLAENGYVKLPEGAEVPKKVEKVEIKATPKKAEPKKTVAKTTKTTKKKQG